MIVGCSSLPPRSTVCRSIEGNLTIEAIFVSIHPPPPPLISSPVSAKTQWSGRGLSLLATVENVPSYKIDHVLVGLQLELITELLGTPTLEDMRYACEGARSHMLRRAPKPPSLTALYNPQQPGDARGRPFALPDASLRSRKFPPFFSVRGRSPSVVLSVSGTTTGATVTRGETFIRSL